MARKPDIPCATCGKLLWNSSTSRPVGEATCRPCRAKGFGPPNRRLVPLKPRKRCDVAGCDRVGALVDGVPRQVLAIWSGIGTGFWIDCSDCGCNFNVPDGEHPEVRECSCRRVARINLSEVESELSARLSIRRSLSPA